MELYQQILASRIGSVTIDTQTAKEIVALEKIRAILADDALSDAECFRKIEAIVCVLEELGGDGGGRHDFG